NAGRAAGFHARGWARVDSSALLARPDELEVPVHVEAVTVGDLVLVDLLLGDRVVLREHLLVAGALEAALRRAEDDLAVRRPRLAVEPRGLDVVGLALHVGALAGDVAVVARADALARRARPVGPLPRLPGALALPRAARHLALPGARALAEHQDLLPARAE